LLAFFFMLLLLGPGWETLIENLRGIWEPRAGPEGSATSASSGSHLSQVVSGESERQADGSIGKRRVSCSLLHSVVALMARLEAQRQVDGVLA
jgi:hypothetical protein